MAKGSITTYDPLLSADLIFNFKRFWTCFITSNLSMSMNTQRILCDRLPLETVKGRIVALTTFCH